jgi:hypothetical protein
MKKFRHPAMWCVLGIVSVMSEPLLAGTVVREIDADTLLVTRFEGKPPHERVYIDRNRDAESFAFYQAKAGILPMPAIAVESRGAPGKTVARNRLRVTSDLGELTEIARLEETTDDSTSSRHWRGAPGKGIRTSR